MMCSMLHKEYHISMTNAVSCNLVSPTHTKTHTPIYTKPAIPVAASKITTITGPTAEVPFAVREEQGPQGPQRQVPLSLAWCANSSLS